MFELIYPLLGALATAILYFGIIYCATERNEKWD